MPLNILDNVNFAAGTKDGWVRDSSNEIAVDGYNIFLQLDTSDGTTGMEVLNSSGAITFATDTVGDGYIARFLGVGVIAPVAAVDVAGTVRAPSLQITTSPITGYSLVSDATGNATWQTPVNTATKNNLVFNVAANTYDQIIYNGLQATNYIVWTNSGMTQKVREDIYTYNGLQVSTAVYKQYDTAGVLFQTITETYTYSGLSVVNIARTLT